MLARRLVASAALLLVAAACSSPSPGEDDVDQSSADLSSKRTFDVLRTGTGCKLQYKTLYVKRGGKVTFDNGVAWAKHNEVTSDDNVSMMIDWPSALGEEDNSVELDITIGEAKSAFVPYLDDELYGDSSSLDFDVYCVPESEKSNGWGTPSGKIRIFK